jgi:large conductance mechanosensitive channel
VKVRGLALIIAMDVFFFVVKPCQAFDARRATADPTIKTCPECLTEIPVGATRCSACTAQQPALSGGSAGPRGFGWL